MLEAELDLTFIATNVPNLYRFGPYCQAQQDGRLSGRLQVGAESCTGDLICYRDHSWGTLPMGAASGWTIACVPDHFYVVIVDMGERQVLWGRYTNPEKEPTPVHAPRMTTLGTGWRIQDPEAGMETVNVQRLAPPLTAFLGTAGQ
ncbi:MAG: hypothetical protein EHM56_06765, partial [Chloroflexi bacterium]